MDVFPQLDRIGTINDVLILIQLVARVIVDLLKSGDLSDAVNSFTTRNQQQFLVA